MAGEIVGTLFGIRSSDSIAAASAGVNVLIIDGNSDDANLASESLEKETDPFYNVERAGRLSTGLERLSLGGIDVALLELQLPDSDGLDALTKLRAHSPGLPILILTGRRDKRLCMNAVMEGAQDYLMKGEMNYLSLARVIQYAIARERAFRSKDNFVGVVCHEIRTPLSVIQGSIEILKERLNGGLSAEQEKFMDIASRNAGFLTKIVDNMLNLSRLESGKTNPSQTPLNVADLILGVLQNFQVPTHHRGLGLQSDVPANLPCVLADMELLQQVLINLMDNAVRFSKQTVIVKAELGLLPPPVRRPFRETRETSQTHRYVQISVIDDGPGIPQSQTGRVFSKFVQLKQPAGTETRKYKGTGLGLAICKEIIEIHGGKIWAESEAGRGATVSFVLPVAPDSGNLDPCDQAR